MKLYNININICDSYFAQKQQINFFLRAVLLSIVEWYNIQYNTLLNVYIAYIITVPEWSSGECVKNGHMQVNGPAGDLSFKIGHSMPIGTISCPWQVKVEQGQQVKFDLFSFLPWRQDGVKVHDHSGPPMQVHPGPSSMEPNRLR